MKRAIVSLADALQCQADLATTGTATKMMLRMLGLDMWAGAVESDADDIRDDIGRVTRAVRTGAPRRAQSGSGRAVDAATVGAADTADASDTSGRDQLSDRLSRMSRIPTRVRSLPRLPTTIGASDEVVPLAAASAPSPPPAPSPLFAGNQRRGILTAAMATLVREGPLDVKQVLAAAVSRRPLAHLPRALRPTVRRGLQVLVDRSDALAPFWRDQDELVGQLRELLGRGRLEVVEFWGFPVPADHPLEAEGEEAAAADRPDPALQPKPSSSGWRAPRPGTPVLVVSDFGIGARVDSDHWVPTTNWLRLTEDLRALGSNVVGLIPYGPSRWPSALSKRIICIPWSERTSAGAVRKAMRRLWTDAHEHQH